MLRHQFQDERGRHLDRRRRIGIVANVNRYPAAAPREIDGFPAIQRRADITAHHIDQVINGAVVDAVGALQTGIHQPARITSIRQVVIFDVGGWLRPDISIPFVKCQRQLRVMPVDDCQGLVQHLRNFVGGRQLGQVDLFRRGRVSPFFGAQRIIMHAELVHLCAGDSQYFIIPAAIQLARRADADQSQVRVGRPHGAREVQVTPRIGLRIAMPNLPVAKLLVADEPHAHSIGLRIAIPRPQRTVFRVRTAIAIFNPSRRFVCIAIAQIRRQYRLGIDQPAQRDELVRADIVGFPLPPGGIEVAWAFVAVADAHLPVIS